MEDFLNKRLGQRPDKKTLIGVSESSHLIGRLT